MDRIYMNRIDGEQRIHIEIASNEVSDVLDDLADDPEHFDATRRLLEILRTAEEIFCPTVSETRRTRDAARQATGQPDVCACGHPRDRHNSACAHCPCVGYAQTWPRQGADRAAACHPASYAGECPCPPNGRCCKVATADPTTADDPTPLRNDLAGPDGPVVEQPIEGCPECISPGACSGSCFAGPPAVGQLAAPAEGRREMAPRRRLEIMIRTDRGSMTAWSPAEVRDALDAYRAAILREAADGLSAAYFPDGLTVQNVRAHLRRMADEATP
ncbi:hypothetical protein [Streptomyces sp. NPDC048338]|uniref:hypothetical protein n=1 Tax=Streptomyces sp. NPDC048338 TaxID=3365536 RepID=UPI00371070AF